MTAPISQQWTGAELLRLDTIIAARNLTAADLRLFPGRTDKAISTQAAKRRLALGIPHGDQGRPRSRVEDRATVSVADACDALLRRQLETQQVPSWTALTAHWQRHGAPSCASALVA